MTSFELFEIFHFLTLFNILFNMVKYDMCIYKLNYLRNHTT